MRRGQSFLILILVLLWAGLGPPAAAATVDTPAGTEAVLFVIGDQHSAYERTAQLTALVARIRAENPELPAAILIDGDTFELGNPVARRSGGLVDFAMFTVFARQAPTILNLGNHEPEFYDLAETVRRIEATGVKVISNIINRATSQPFAPAATPLKLGPTEAVVVGVTTDRLATYRAAVRPSLDLADPVVWAKQSLGKLLAGAPLPIVLSHAGLEADRAMLELVPDGTLFVGAHNHIRLIHEEGRTVYFHSGSWNEFLSVVWLCRDEAGVARWVVEQVTVDPQGPADPELEKLVRTTGEQYLEPADGETVGWLPHALSPGEAARLAVSAVKVAAKADAAVIGNTTFGGGLPAGDVTRYVFDACVRFDGAVAVAEVDGRRLAQILDRANPAADAPFAERTGEYLVADGPENIDPARTYRLATNDWGVRNQKKYFAGEEFVFEEIPGLKVKAAVLSALATASPPPEEAVPDDALTVDQLYDLGKTLFETFAPDEIKEQFEFPSKEQWDAFAVRFQHALESDSLEELAEFEPQAKAALAALRTLPGYEDYADWLEERIDYVEAAKQAVLAPAPAVPAVPTPDAPVKPAGANIPHYDLWLARVQARPVPANAAKLMPGLRRTFAAAGVPADLAWLAEVESTFNPEARSPAGAKGLFQLMPATAKELGLSTFLPDERTDPEKSARAAAKMLGQLHARFNDWPLALAAYNAGAGRVQRTLEKKSARTFAEIASALPAETRMYVPKVLATLMVRAGLSPENI